MKRKILGLFFCSLLIGCVPTLQPLYTEKDIIFDPQLVGVWSEENSRESWHFAAGENKSYKLTYTDAEGAKGEFEAHLVKLGPSRFLDLFPDEAGLKAAGRNGYYNYHYLPVHSFIQVQEISPVLKMSVMETGWLEQLLDKEPGALHHERTQKHFVVTASTKDLQAFVLKHLQTEGAWGRPSNLKRREN